ncbi:hypothetical protein [Acinetobacter phage ABPH49]|nr:hypothetical protein [Acinetobacter phage ABPH49]
MWIFEDLWDAMKFEDGIFIGIAVWLVAFLFIVLPIAMYKDSVEMDAQHCVKTGQSETKSVTTWLTIGKVMVPQTTLQTQYEYSCDDHIRWR